MRKPTNATNLTERQQRVLDAVTAVCSDHTYKPIALREIAKRSGLGDNNTSESSKLLAILVERGLLLRRRGQSSSAPYEYKLPTKPKAAPAKAHVVTPAKPGKPEPADPIVALKALAAEASKRIDHGGNEDVEMSRILDIEDTIMRMRPASPQGALIQATILISRMEQVADGMMPKPLLAAIDGASKMLRSVVAA